MAVLSAKAQKTLVVALGSKAAATEFQAIVNARAGTPSRVLSQAVSAAMTSRTVLEANGRIPTARELLSALVSGANLGLACRRKMLIMMAGDSTPSGGMEAMGNELINFVQTTPQTRKTVL